MSMALTHDEVKENREVPFASHTCAIYTNEKLIHIYMTAVPQEAINKPR